MLQSSRLEDQRSSLITNKPALQTNENELKFVKKQQAITVPPNDDDLFTLIQKLQSRRLDEQRSEVPKTFNNVNSKILNNKN